LGVGVGIGFGTGVGVVAGGVCGAAAGGVVSNVFVPGVCGRMTIIPGRSGAGGTVAPGVVTGGAFGRMTIFPGGSASDTTIIASASTVSLRGFFAHRFNGGSAEAVSGPNTAAIAATPGRAVKALLYGTAGLFVATRIHRIFAATAKAALGVHIECSTRPAASGIRRVKLRALGGVR
jgi:hypothetical protein